MPPAPHKPTPQDSNTTLRVDKWLWAARFYKTRSLASGAIDAGHVRVNGQRCKPARELRIGDVMHITRGTLEIEIHVKGLSAIRGPAPVAQSLYSETAESLAKREAEAELRRIAPVAAPAGGRPTKRDRRNIDRLHESG